MTNLGRNDPCPCGSGKKFKKCCLRKEQEAAAAKQEESNAVGTALAWLSERYPEEVEAAVRVGFFDSLSDEEMDLLDDLPPGIPGMLEINIGEWLLTDAELELDEEPVPTRELLFEPGGPILTAAGRGWLEEIGRRPMGLFEVQRVTPGEGLEVRDLLREDSESVWVVERSASRSLVQWDTIGARLARRGDDWVFTGAIYPLPRDAAENCAEEIQDLRQERDWDSVETRVLIHDVICAGWLEFLVAEPAIPEVFDVSTGEPLLLTTIHYKVRDWEKLAELLEAEPDVEGDREDGWVRFEEAEGDLRRSRAALNPREPDRLEVFCRTEALADAAREWLGEIAGDAVELLTREVVDPTSPKARAAAAEQPRERLPPKLEAELIAQALHRHYANWTEEPIPALDGRTPRECLDTDEGRRAVVDLLKSYEQHEARRAREQETEPFDFGFLWERLGLTPDGPSGT